MNDESGIRYRPMYGPTVEEWIEDTKYWCEPALIEDYVEIYVGSRKLEAVIMGEGGSVLALANTISGRLFDRRQGPLFETNKTYANLIDNPEAFVGALSSDCSMTTINSTDDCEFHLYRKGSHVLVAAQYRDGELENITDLHRGLVVWDQFYA